MYINMHSLIWKLDKTMSSHMSPELFGSSEVFLFNGPKYLDVKCGFEAIFTVVKSALNSHSPINVKL